MTGLWKIVAAMTAIVTLGSAAAVMLMPPSTSERGVRREHRARRLVGMLCEEIRRYREERGEYPPGDGIGTASLVRALSEPSRTGTPYVPFMEEMLTETGDLRNPVDPGQKILFYRNNRTAGTPGAAAHAPGAFDLWGEDAEGNREGVNNWDGVVSGP